MLLTSKSKANMQKKQPYQKKTNPILDILKWCRSVIRIKKKIIYDYVKKKV